MKPRVLDIFSGIGGFSLGLERAGMETVAFCEIDPFCRRVLKKHWSKVKIYEDVRTLTAERLAADSIVVDVIAGGFPCQDISVAGKGAGISGERSGLWREYVRLLRELQPDLAIVENVSALRGRGLDRVLGDLAALGFDAEWHCIPASAVGAPHRRDRIWIVAYPDSSERGPLCGPRDGLARTVGVSQWEEGSGRFEPSREDVADADTISSEGLRSNWRQGVGTQFSPREVGRSSENVSDAAHHSTISEGIRRGDTAGQWRIEPDVGRVAHGVSARVDRLRSLGNAVVPQIPEMIGRAALQYLNRARAA